jgi:hypothetical protein
MQVTEAILYFWKFSRFVYEVIQNVNRGHETEMFKNFLL